MKRRLLVLSSLFVLAGFVAADAVEARGGGGGGSRGGGAGRSAARAARAASKKDGKKRDIEAARERLRQLDYRDQDSSRDRNSL